MIKSIYLLILLSLIACSQSTSVEINISVDESLWGDEPMKVGEKIGLRVWDGDLKKNIKLSIPELEKANLDEILGIQWFWGKLNNVDSEPNKLYIKCIFSSSKHDEFGVRAVEICRDEVKSTIQKLLSKHEKTSDQRP